MDCSPPGSSVLGDSSMPGAVFRQTETGPRRELFVETGILSDLENPGGLLSGYSLSKS